MDLIGKRFGNYEIESELGRGGMATVYRARQISLNRAVAFKVLGPSYVMDETTRKRFEHEALAVAQLSHPHIVPVYDFGDDSELGLLYIVMELVPGGHIGALRGRKLAAAEIVPAIAQIGRALDYAHRQGIIHRDVKPGNILLNTDGRPMLTDFGLVRWEQAALHTETGITVGTPTYMSPEQAQGGDLDGRADEYSLSMVLYELLTGRPAYEGGSAVDIMHQIVYAPLLPPRHFNSTVPRHLEAVIVRALARDRNQRYGTAAEFADALDKAVRRRRAAPVNLAEMAAEDSAGALPSPSDDQTALMKPSLQTRMAQASRRVLARASRAALIAALVLLLAGVAAVLIAASAGAGEAERSIGGYAWPWAEVSGAQPKMWDEATLLARIEPWLGDIGLSTLAHRQVRILPNNIVYLYGDTPYLPVSIELRLFVIGDTLQLRWERFNGITPFAAGDIVATGANRGLQRAFDEAPVGIERIETKPGQLLMYFKTR